MHGLIDCLRSFNSKERFFLLGQVLGNPDFTPSSSFREELGRVLGLHIPEDSLSAMDYHLDWIYASLKLAAEGHRATHIHSNAEGIIKAQQEDVDYLLAYDSGDDTHLLLIEAKAVTGWTNKQMASKVARLVQIFGNDGRIWPGVIPHLVIMSPRQPRGLKTDAWPQWIAPNGEIPWLRLSVPAGLKAVSRFDAQGKRDANGLHWKVSARRY